ncbi:hypothetical protein P106B_56 [Rhizobium phage vB_RglS_P106B]|uniref:Uncharacterized protein n=1 Tax=Rhizobium phage vB_RglS_P106B TaxID=1458697 RepID=W6E8N0_9CAUD|nr:hypothetical protein P106B_56 [Rhizobium phage vB_RglS_P106B]AHJ10739.1 hypothetical protein P106B_56 [Rhizobium phage vB_RglS_P106B]
MKTVAEIAEELRGTCQTLTIVLENNDMDGMDNDAAFCAELDSLVFCCERCDWWHEQSEMSDKFEAWICEECASEVH